MATVTGYPGSFRKMERINHGGVESREKKEESPYGSHAGFTL